MSIFKYNVCNLTLGIYCLSFTFFQFLFQLLDLFLKLPQQSILWILVDSGFVLDVFSPVSVAQGTDGLIVVVVRRADICTLVGKMCQKELEVKIVDQTCLI